MPCIPVSIWPELLEAQLMFTSVNYHRIVQVSMPLNQRLVLTMLRAAGPRGLGLVIELGPRKAGISETRGNAKVDIVMCHCA